tara:strand:- start:376 stop:885 length:510 start_codon:yes stop_codon:yes gene_type:complete
MKPQKGDLRKDGMKYDGRQWRTVGIQNHMNNRGYIYHGDKYRSLDSFLQQGGKIENIVHGKSKVKDFNAIVKALYDAEASGDVYVITNPAWPEWVKVGKAIDASDRCNNYQTGSPLRDYTVVASVHSEDRHTKEAEMHTLFEEHASDRNSEWFKISQDKAKELLNGHSA